MLRSVLVRCSLFWVLSVLSACGSSGKDGNRWPVADAGPDRSTVEGDAVTLDGSASRDADGSIVAYEWIQTAGPGVTLADARTARARFTAPEVNASSALRFRLTVTDDGGVRNSDEVVITVADAPGGNLAPSADAGLDQSVASGAAVTLTGAGADADGQIVGYAWTQIDGPGVALSDAATSSASFTAPSVTTTTQLGFRLTVTDDVGATGSDTVNVIVNPPQQNQVPTADAGTDQLVDEGTTVTLHGSGADGDGSIAGYAWQQTAGPGVVLTDANTAQPQFTAPEVAADTELRFALTVTDDDGAASAADEVAVTVRDTDTTEPPPADETALVPVALQALLAGCDLLDAAHCLLPFPSDHFTTAAPAGSPQSTAQGGSGRRVAFNPLAMPRNLAGKPIDPTEWNRNDGFSPGALIVTQVPGLSLEKTWNLPADQIGIANLALSLGDDAAIQVLEVPQAPETATPRRQLVWAELDANAGVLIRPEGSEIAQPLPHEPSLLIRPAKNFSEGRRYVVVLRRLKNAAGEALPANTAFALCRDGATTMLPPLSERCAALEASVFPVLDAAGIARDSALYLAWDFTVASTANQIGRLRHMRDDAFEQLARLPGADCSQHSDAAACRAPAFTVDQIIESPQTGIARRIEGTLRVPSYVLPQDPSPSEDPQLQAVIQQIADQLPDAGPVADLINAASSGSLPPNHLFYNALDGLNPADPQGSLYGDGLPDATGEMTTRFICQIPAQATPDDPARAGLYGHGLLDSRAAVTYDGVPEFSREYNRMFCAVDWFGFATGDLPNVLSVLVDLSNFRVIPDASQQGMVNFMYLARLMRHPQGFAAHPAFQDSGSGRPLFDRSEVFYDGNSQGGILGGVVLAASKDVNRGVLGSLGMNYSTLLQRSVDFDLYAIPLYLSYPDPTERDLAFSLIQMLWDRSENNGYAAHLVDNSAFGGPTNVAKLDPQFGDHQVSMWTADVMARTMGIAVDAGQTPRVAVLRGESDRHPDVTPYFGLDALDFANEAQAAGSAMIVWDDARTEIPPIENLAPRAGRDPHDDSAKKKSGRCQKAHFLRSGGRLINVTDYEFSAGFDETQCPAVSPAPPTEAVPPLPGVDGYGAGVTGTLARFGARSHDLVDAMLAGDVATAGGVLQTMVGGLAEDLQALSEAASPEELLGLNQGIPGAVLQALSAQRDVEAVVVPGALLNAWTSPPAAGVPYPYPSGAYLAQCPSPFDALCSPVLELLESLVPGSAPVRDAHNGELIYPATGEAIAGVPVNEVAAYAYRDGGWVEIPVQVDERMPYFLANGNSTFSIYSGTDPETNYVWDTEAWAMTQGSCSKAYDTNATDDGANQGLPGPTADPVPGIDADDEVVFMAADAGEMAPAGARPGGVRADPGQQIALVDPLDPATLRYVYLFRKDGGSAFRTQHYVKYLREADADEWIDRNVFRGDDFEKLGTSNTNYGANLTGTICVASLEAYHGDDARCSFDPASGKHVCPSSDRFPRDGLVVSSDTYRWRASGRWMVRELRVAKPNRPGDYGPDLVDRWKGRAFQQSPDSVISLVGFEDEQVNWEGNSSLLGERCGPVRCIRETWGADSGTNVTKTETFYRDAISYRYRVRVHPIPPDGLYTSWDYNRDAMLPTAQEAAAGVPGGRYYTILRPQGVPIDGINDDTGNVDGFAPLFGYCPSSDGVSAPNADGRCPAFFDVADPTFNLPLAFDNWEQISGKGDSGSLVYTFLLRGATSLLNPLVVPYYRDDACLDDGTGDDPVTRPYPGDNSGDTKVRDAYVAMARLRRGDPALSYADLRCDERQGAHAAHGLHFFVTHDTDNLFTPLASTEIDGEQWQFIVPTSRPQNVAEPYANVARFPLQPVVVPVP